MHAVVVTIGIEPGRVDEATAILHNFVVPQAQSSPGFASGTWARMPDGTTGHSVVIYDTAANAHAALAAARESVPAGAPVNVLYAEVYEVVAQA
jgi:hypothetical protein